jgi:A/G-specific adenine glycosylase
MKRDSTHIPRPFQWSQSWKQTFRLELLKWFDKEFRDLPWRQTNDPYAVWISEIMLQQTQVKTVIPYYHRFLEAFPSVYDLSRANLSHVLKLWEGLGYYARARNMHKAAKILTDRFDGHIPVTQKEIETLPGIGPYTAAAILSIAFDKPLAVVDGNVNRVLARLFRVSIDPKSPEGKPLFAALAGDLLSPRRPGDHNQALMELGAILCKSRSPRCESCPVHSHCEAARHNEQNQFPIRTPRKPRPHHHIAVGIIWDLDKLLIARRHEDAMLGGLWEFPGGKMESGEDAKTTVQREIQEELGLEVEVGDHLATIEHGYTHFTITLMAYHCRYLGGTPQALGCSEWKWIHPEQLSDYAFPRANRKILEQLSL